MTALWALITGSAIGRTLAKIGALVLAVLTFGQFKKRQGAADQRAKAKAAQAKSERETHDRINQANTGAGATDDERRQRLRDFAAKHGNRPSKGKGG